MSEKILTTVYVNGEAVSNTACYSVESYVARLSSSDETLVALVKAMLRYGDAAAAYVN